MTTHRGWTDRGKLSHFDSAATCQAVTFRLADSLPQRALARGREQHADNKAFLAWLSQFLDAGHGDCLLGHAPIAELVQSALLHFHGERYDLHAWVIMPNHVHALFTQREDVRLADILQSWKSFTAKEINKQNGRSGEVWASEYFDRYIRSESHFHGAVHYIEENPVKAGLVQSAEDWRWSSASIRSARVPRAGSEPGS